MRKGMLLGLVLGLMILGTASVSSAQGGPVLEGVWAPAEVNFGAVLKVYVKASDPEGDMRWILVSIGKSGQAEPAGSTMIRLKKEVRKSVNGFVFFDTSKAANKQTEGKITIQVEDFKGQESEAKTVTVKLVPKGAKAEKAPADFQEIPIGPVMMQNVERPY
jgi:hypothetical protein